MNDAEPGEGQNQPKQSPNLDWLVWAPRGVKRAFQQRRAEMEKETPADRAARRTASATIWIAIFTFVSIGVGISQFCIFNNQLSVMRGQLNESVIEQRPWIYADIGSGGKIYWNQSGGITIQTAFKLHNTGHLPAFYVSPDVEGYIPGEDGVTGAQVVREKQHKRCDNPLQQPRTNDQIGVTVFPNQEVTIGVGIGISKSSLDSVKSYLKVKFGKELDSLAPWIVGCIRYKSTDGEFHQTGVALVVSMKKPGKDGLYVLPVDPTGVDADNIVFSSWIEGGTAYAN